MNLNDPVAYFDSIEAPEPIRARARTLIRYYTRLLGGLDGDLVLSELPAADGSRDFRSLWVFTAEWAMEANFGNDEREELDGTARGGFNHWVVRAENYDFDAAVDGSRLQVELWFANEVLGEINASGKNCDHLVEIVRRYIGGEV